jgi:predicted alternative tryptophan synthase beta-subunit
MESLRFVLPQSEIPTHWYNVVADMPNPPLPPLGPDGKPATPEQMGAIFPMAILEQEMSSQRWIPIPQSVREIYRLWHPSPLVRAARLEEMLGTPARIYYKNEGVSPVVISPENWKTSTIRKKQSRHHCSICRCSADAKE